MLCVGLPRKQDLAEGEKSGCDTITTKVPADPVGAQELGLRDQAFACWHGPVVGCRCPLEVQVWPWGRLLLQLRISSRKCLEAGGRSGSVLEQRAEVRGHHSIHYSTHFRRNRNKKVKNYPRSHPHTLSKGLTSWYVSSQSLNHTDTHLYMNCVLCVCVYTYTHIHTHIWLCRNESYCFISCLSLNIA